MTPSHIDLGLVLHFMRAAMRDRAREIQSRRGTADIQYGSLIEPTLLKMGQAQIVQLPSGPRYGSLDSTVVPELARLLVEAFHYLLHNGFITRQPAPPNFPGHTNVNGFVITQRGLEWADGEEPVPEDARRYLEVLRSLVPNLDDIIRQYIEESLVAYQRQAYFAAAVMLGAACEKAVHLLAGAFLRSVPSEGKLLAHLSIKPAQSVAYRLTIDAVPQVIQERVPFRYHLNVPSVPERAFRLPAVPQNH
jgi:hypothetical protein